MVDVLVIGAGAAGCVAAIKAAEAGLKVALIEKNAKIGRKIMITGKGRCNITNAKQWQDFSSHLHPKPSFFKPAFFNFSNEATIGFFNSIGVSTVLTRDDRIFPESMSAATVVDALDARLRKLKVGLMFNCDVIKVGRGDESFETTFVDSTLGDAVEDKILSHTVIVATGGLAYPSTGSTGAGYAIAESFGHTIKPTFPSLTALVPEHYDTRLAGQELINVTAALTVGRDTVACEFGDLQFTDGGIEGPIGFRISRKAVWALMNGDKVTVSIDLKPAVKINVLKGRIAEDAAIVGVNKDDFERRQRSFLRKYLPQAIIDPFIDANNPTLDNLAQLLKEWKFKIVDYVGYRRAVVTAGGVSLDEVVSKTMGSRNMPGLFFAGEVLDIDGDTGGYNLQVAFSTGALAASGAAQFIRESNKS
ncbi:MAG: aminoacetone oxidase family FAD-binding enzyme [Bacteroidales bacterium]|nr:aminoacetone oxidase family FAD-binding enzyme [Bacteroidales bacterium]